MVSAYQFVKVTTGLVKSLEESFYIILIYTDILSHTNTFLGLHLKLYKFEGYFTIVTILFQISTPLYLILDCPGVVLLRGGYSKSLFRVTCVYMLWACVCLKYV